MCFWCLASCVSACVPYLSRVVALCDCGTCLVFSCSLLVDVDALCALLLLCVLCMSGTISQSAISGLPWLRVLSISNEPNLRGATDAVPHTVLRGPP